MTTERFYDINRLKKYSLMIWKNDIDLKNDIVSKKTIKVKCEKYEIIFISVRLK